MCAWSVEDQPDVHFGYVHARWPARTKSLNPFSAPFAFPFPLLFRSAAPATFAAAASDIPRPAARMDPCQRSAGQKR